MAALCLNLRLTEQTLQSADTAGLLEPGDIQRLATAAVAAGAAGDVTPPGRKCQACPCKGALC
eukprot:1156715-Pyramimonas_sp.AAC.1